MPCIAPPPPQIEASIQVVTGSALQAIFIPNPDDGSANYINSSGDLDFSCFKKHIRVTLMITTPGVVFFRDRDREGLSFSDDERGSDHKPVGRYHHQFPGGVHGAGTSTITFVYKNDWDGGRGDGVPRFPRSKYGFYLGNASRYLGEIDPIVQNGGNQ
jgi:hypothetical protein